MYVNDAAPAEGITVITRFFLFEPELLLAVKLTL
jgi:hypothetical protein